MSHDSPQQVAKDTPNCNCGGLGLRVVSGPPLDDEEVTAALWLTPVVFVVFVFATVTCRVSNNSKATLDL